MTDEEAKEFARHHALAAGRLSGAKPYLPVNDPAARSWQPHEWVLNAIIAAYKLGRDDMLAEQEARFAEIKPEIVDAAFKMLYYGETIKPDKRDEAIKAVDDPRGTHAEKYFTDEGVERIADARRKEVAKAYERTCSDERPCVPCFTDQGECLGPAVVQLSAEESAKYTGPVAASSPRICGLCHYQGYDTDHLGQCPRCHWDELRPLQP